MKAIRYALVLLVSIWSLRVFAQDSLTPTNVAGPASLATPATTWLPNTLFKLGTGVGRNTGYGGYFGLLLPITLGAEYQLNRAFSVYGNLSPRMNFPRRSYGYDTPLLVLTGVEVALGGRYYYNQEKRERLGRAHGLFVGNYLALQANSTIGTYKFRNTTDSRRRSYYDHSTLMALWGMQRRIGQWGLFDGSAGAGLDDTRFRYSYDPNTGSSSVKRHLDLMLEINVRVSLAH